MGRKRSKKCSWEMNVVKYLKLSVWGVHCELVSHRVTPQHDQLSFRLLRPQTTPAITFASNRLEKAHQIFSADEALSAHTQGENQWKSEAFHQRPKSSFLKFNPRHYTTFDATRKYFFSMADPIQILCREKKAGWVSCYSSIMFASKAVVAKAKHQQRQQQQKKRFYI